MLRMILLAGVTGLLVGPLAGCANCSRDPSQVGMGCAAANLASGTYREDDAAIEREIAATRARTVALRAEHARNQERARALSGERRALARRLADLNAATAALSDRVAELEEQGRRGEELRALRERTQRLADEQIDLGESGTDPREAELERLEAERRAIQRDIDHLLSVS